jgi:hypothetical protein
MLRATALTRTRIDVSLTGGHLGSAARVYGRTRSRAMDSITLARVVAWLFVAAALRPWLATAMGGALRPPTPA